MTSRAPRKLRILQVMRAPVGGLFRHVVDLTKALAAHGHEVGLVVDSLANDAQTENRLAALEPHLALGIHRFAMPRLLGAGDLRTPLAVRQLSRRLKIDILHGHGAKGGFYARLARLAGGGARAIYTPHGGVLHFSTSSRAGRVFHKLERGLMRQTATIIFESAYARTKYAELIGAPTCPSLVIHNGLAPDEFIPVTLADNAADFVFVGELRALKGIHVLIDALAGVTRADGQKANLVMAGDGPDRTALVAQIERLGLSDRVVLAGARPARTMFALGRCAVVPSLAESLPYVVLEAAAAQLPVIATRVGGLPEIFGPTSESLIPAGDVDALRTAMQAAIDRPLLAQTEMMRRLDHIATSFTVARMSADIEAQYQAVSSRA